MQVIQGYILIESPADENDDQFCQAIESILLEIYGQRPDWLRFSAGVRFTRGGSHFREFVCVAGSVSCQMMLRAGRDGGLQRALIYRAEDDSIARAYEVRAGQQTEFRPDELQALQAP